MFQFPKGHWKKLRTSNGIERVNKEIKRRTRVAVLFPNKEWVTGKQYLDMTPLLGRGAENASKKVNLIS